VTHLPTDVHANSLAQVRPKTIGRPEHVRACADPGRLRGARLLDTTLNQLAAEGCPIATNAEIGSRLGVCESVVRRMRTGDVPLTQERFYLLPRRVQVRFTELQLADLLAEDAADSSPIAVQMSIIEATREHGEAAAAVLEACRDNRIDAAERTRIESESLDVIEAHRRVIVHTRRMAQAGAP
jgi:hypothetical protein